MTTATHAPRRPGVDGDPWDFRILGPLTVLDSRGTPLHTGTRKQRAVLAVLLLEPGRVVSLDRIISGLWADEAPSSATGTLQAYISQLRRILEPDRSPRATPRVLLTREPGYLLAIRPEQVDAVRFAGRVEAARGLLDAGAFGAAQETLVAALGEWRGEALPEFAGEEFAGPAVARLDGLRNDAMEHLTEAWLALGHHSRAAAQARTLVDRDPFRERAWGQLMLALYRDGRQAEALESFRQARRILDEELGLPPGPQLRALEESILRHDPALAGPVPGAPPTAIAIPETEPSVLGCPADGDAGPTNSTSPPAPGSTTTATDTTGVPTGSGIVGRTVTLARITDRLAATRTGRGGLLIVSGRAGVGKTIFAERAVDRAAADGVTTIWSRCVEGSATPAFWPWIQILRALPPGTPTGPLLDALTGRGGPVAGTDDPDAARFHLHETTAELLRSVARQAPLLVVIDDLHLADAASLRLLHHVAAELDRLPILVLATTRSEPGDLGGPLRETLGGLANASGVERVGLQPFTVDDVADYLRAGTGVEPDVDVVRALHERTGGNAFYLKELLRLLASEHPVGWGAPQVRAESAVPESVRDVISRRVARMPEGTQSLLRAAAVIGRDVDAVLLETTAGIDNEQLMGLLEPAVATGLLLEVPDGWDYRFAHALVRDALYAELNRLQRARIHRRVGEAMEALHPVDDLTVAGLLAHHFAAAARIGTADRAVRYARRAAQLAAAQLAYDEAVGFLETALAALDPTATDAAARRGALLIELGRARRLAGDVVGARTALDEAVGLGTGLRDDHLVIEAATVFGGVTHWNWRPYGHVDHRMVAILEDQIARLDPGDRVRRAELLGTLGVELFYSDRQPDGERMAAEAVALARECGDVELRIRTLNNYCVASWIPDRGTPRLRAASEILDLGPLPRRVEVVARLHRMMVLMTRGELAAYDADLARCRHLVTEVPLPELAAQVTYAAAGRAILSGRWAEAERLVAEAVDEHRRTSMWGTEWIRLMLLHTCRRFQGRPGELLDELVGAAEEPELQLLRPTAVLAACESGDEPLARRLIDRWGTAIRRDWAWDIVTCQWALVAVRLGVPDPARLHDSLVPFADRFVSVGSGGATWGSSRYFLAGLAERLGWRDEAVAHARAGLAAHEALGVAHLVEASRRQVAALD
ncbi:BTAD domain-containing putative transcriptional regulator [Micromonospora echinofusca]|uniref:AAA family ATPase n=1 Tax=Micromonospora echinofusca TaxID=47858 RepID=A0ABS3W0Z4_MICEH|nr:BTAD domain-containing putative transcriptional regulator [Micromonospora echinofusca]MBO4210343.1 AAA family ATPase [Micromonospora echinofusca]